MVYHAALKSLEWSIRENTSTKTEKRKP
jgi:hypothetical protein